VLIEFKEKIMKKFIPRVPAALFIGTALLLFVAIMEYPLPSHRGVQNVYCINNLRQIDFAANQFALEHDLTNGSPINFPNDLTPYIKLNRDGKIPACPQGGVYHISKVGEKPTCSLGTTVTPAHVLQ
jgi:hypothetical protein